MRYGSIEYLSRKAIQNDIKNKKLLWRLCEERNIDVKNNGVLLEGNCKNQLGLTMAWTRVAVEVVGSDWIQLYFAGSTNKLCCWVGCRRKSKRIKDDFKLFGIRTGQMELIYFWRGG